jgi:threonine 3-dehydrogenase
MYGVTKVAGELMGAYYAAKRGVDFRSVRFPGLLSPTPPGGGSSDYANEMYFAAAQGKNCDHVFVAPETTLPFMYMPDAIRALLELSTADESKLTRRTYNIAAVSPTAKEIADSIRKSVPSFREAYKPDHRKAFVDSWPDRLDDSVARKDWGWKHAFDLDAMTTELLTSISALLRAESSA